MARPDKPNILVLQGDDIGWWNISYNSRGQMGYRTPNIDRVANEGVAFTDYYAQQSCTAGRAALSLTRIRSVQASPRSVCLGPISV
jgi:arylsulfatase A-like enzyme